MRFFHPLFSPLYFLGFLATITNAYTAPQNLTFIGLFPFSGGGWDVGHLAQPSMIKAINDINADPNLLPNTHLVFSPEKNRNANYGKAQCVAAQTCTADETAALRWNTDDRCNAADGVVAFMKQVEDVPDYDVVVSSGCSVVCQPNTLMSKFLKRPIVSWGCSSPSLSNKDTYKWFVRTDSTDMFIAQAWADFVTAHGWLRYGMVINNAELYALSQDAFVARMSSNSGGNSSMLLSSTVEIGRVTLTDAKRKLQSMVDAGVKIFVCGMYKAEQHIVMRAADSLGIVGPGYVWIWLWPRPGTDLPSDPAEAAEIVRISQSMFGYNPTASASAKTQAFDAWFLANHPGETSVFAWAGKTYDAVYAAAYAMEKVIQDQTPPPYGEALLAKLHLTNFEGVSGRVVLDPNGDRYPEYDLFQLRGSDAVAVASWNANGLTMKPESPIIWKGNTGVPRDRFHVVLQLRAVGSDLITVGDVLCGFGLLLCALLFAFNWAKRKHKYMKPSSPHITSVTIVGAAVGYLSIALSGRHSGVLCPADVLARGQSCPAAVGMCSASLWTLNLGFTLTFASLFAKIHRVFKLFNDEKMRRFIIPDRKLFQIIAALLFVDVVYLSIWAAVAPMRVTATALPREAQLDSVVEPYTEACSSDHHSVFMFVLMGAKLMALFYGASLAYETRDVNFRACNDSKPIGMAIYNMVVLCTVVIPVAFLLGDKPSAQHALLSVAVFATLSLVLLVVFLPKIWAFKNGTADAANVVNTGGTVVTNVKSKAASSRRVAFEQSSPTAATKSQG